MSSECSPLTRLASPASLGNRNGPVILNPELEMDMTATKTLFVVRATEAAGDDYPNNRYEDGFRGGYTIAESPRIGDVILDVLTIRTYQGGSKYRIDSAAAWAKDLRLEISASANWGDQYEPGAEIELRDAAVSALLHGQESSPHYGVASCEFGPIHWLRWSLAPDESTPSEKVLGDVLTPVAS